LTTLNAIGGDNCEFRYGAAPAERHARPRLGVLKVRLRAFLASLRWDPMTREERAWDRMEQARARLNKEWP
jgi:hypothetical protein